MSSGRQRSADDAVQGERRRNSFDIIRLIAALAVAFGHQADFAGRAEPALGPLGISISNLGLFAFFALSGYLVFKSLERDPRLVRFAAARLLRIYPGAIVNTVACVLLGSVVTSTAAAVYWRDPQTWSYLLHGLAIVVMPTTLVLPGVFADARWPDVNTPIWTLKYELLFYLVMFVLFRVLAPRVRMHRVLGVLLASLTAALACYFALLSLPAPEEFYTRYNGFNLLRFGMVFAAGAYLASVDGLDVTWRLVPLFSCVALVVLSPLDATSRVGLILLFVLLVIEVGRSPLLFSRRYRETGDFSFGIYLYAYPIGQVMMLNFGQRLSFLEETGLALICTGAVAVASWYLIEQPAQELKRLF